MKIVSVLALPPSCRRRQQRHRVCPSRDRGLRALAAQKNVENLFGGSRAPDQPGRQRLWPVGEKRHLEETGPFTRIRTLERTLSSVPNGQSSRSSSRTSPPRDGAAADDPRPAYEQPDQSATCSSSSARCSTHPGRPTPRIRLVKLGESPSTSRSSRTCRPGLRSSRGAEDIYLRIRTCAQSGTGLAFPSRHVQRRRWYDEASAPRGSPRPRGARAGTLYMPMSPRRRVRPRRAPSAILERLRDGEASYRAGRRH